MFRGWRAEEVAGIMVLVFLLAVIALTALGVVWVFTR